MILFGYYMLLIRRFLGLTAYFFYLGFFSLNSKDLIVPVNDISSYIEYNIDQNPSYDFDKYYIELRRRMTIEDRKNDFGLYSANLITHIKNTNNYRQDSSYISDTTVSFFPNISFKKMGGNVHVDSFLGFEKSFSLRDIKENNFFDFKSNFHFSYPSEGNIGNFKFSTDLGYFENTVVLSDANGFGQIIEIGNANMLSSFRYYLSDLFSISTNLRFLNQEIDSDYFTDIQSDSIDVLCLLSLSENLNLGFGHGVKSVDLNEKIDLEPADSFENSTFILFENRRTSYFGYVGEFGYKNRRYDSPSTFKNIHDPYSTLFFYYKPVEGNEIKFKISKKYGSNLANNSIESEEIMGLFQNKLGKRMVASADFLIQNKTYYNASKYREDDIRSIGTSLVYNWAKHRSYIRTFLNYGNIDSNIDSANSDFYTIGFTLYLTY